MGSPELDRTLAICDLLLGAAHADAHFHDQERRRVRELLSELGGASALAPEIAARIDAFSPAGFEVGSAAAAFRTDAVDERRKLLHLVAAVHDADEELDLAEDDYLRALGAALDLPADELQGLALEFEVEELRDSFASLRKVPPPIPDAARSAKPRAGDAAGESIDVKLDE